MKSAIFVLIMLRKRKRKCTLITFRGKMYMVIVFDGSADVMDLQCVVIDLLICERQEVLCSLPDKDMNPLKK